MRNLFSLNVHRVLVIAFLLLAVAIDQTALFGYAPVVAQAQEDATPVATVTAVVPDNDNGVVIATSNDELVQVISQAVWAIAILGIFLVLFLIVLALKAPQLFKILSETGTSHIDRYIKLAAANQQVRVAASEGVIQVSDELANFMLKTPTKIDDIGIPIVRQGGRVLGRFILGDASSDKRDSDNMGDVEKIEDNR